MAYGVPRASGEHDLALAAVTVRDGFELDAESLSATLRSLPADQRPALVHVVDSIPVTTWFRPMTSPLREAGIPEPGAGKRAWYLDRSGRSYRPLSVPARKRLTAALPDLSP
jgi:putative long chain acyl-CoA synthase